MLRRLIIRTAFLTVIVQSADAAQTRQEAGVVALESAQWKVEVAHNNPGGVPVRKVFARRGGDWRLLAEGFVPDYTAAGPDAVRLWDMRENPRRHLVTALAAHSVTAGPAEIIIRMEHERAVITETITAGRDDACIHVSVRAELPGTPAELDFLLSAYTFVSPDAPDFIHTPGVKFDDPRAGAGKDQMTGDRSFHAPAVILQSRQDFTALVPDLDVLNSAAVVSTDARRAIRIGRGPFSIPVEDARYTMPSGLDLNVRSGLTGRPVMTFGLMDSVIGHHIRYVRDGRGASMVRHLKSPQAGYAVDLFVSAETGPGRGYERISQWQWQRWGHAVFAKQAHLAFPFEEYVKLVSRAVFSPVRTESGGPVQTPGGVMDAPVPGFEDRGSWLEWDEQGVPMGGFRCAAPFWNDVLHHSLFWNDARDATGMYFWGRETGDEVLVQRARRIINFCLSAPRNDRGLFHTVFNAATRKWGRGWTDPLHNRPQLFLRDAACYEVAALCKTGAHLLDFHHRAEADPRIVAYLRPFAAWLVENTDDRGTVPSFVDADMTPSPLLRDSAQPAAAMWFLAEMHAATGSADCLAAAVRIAGWLEREIIPSARWIDFEQYLSCGAKPFTMVRDEWQAQWFRGNLCVIWAAEGFAALNRTAPGPRWLSLGARCLDYLAFTQCVWQPHYIYTANPFGGFGVDNSDSAPMLDQRQSETVRPFLYFGRELGRQDFIERGISAARSACVLIVHPNHTANGIFPHPMFYPAGLAPENIDHEAHPQCPMRTHPSWGEASAVFTGLAETRRALGGLFIDAAHHFAVGVDGVRVTSAEFDGGTVRLEVDNILGRASLRKPWDHEFDIRAVTVGPPVSMMLNGQPLPLQTPVLVSPAARPRPRARP